MRIYKLTIKRDPTLGDISCTFTKDQCDTVDFCPTCRIYHPFRKIHMRKLSKFNDVIFFCLWCGTVMMDYNVCNLNNLIDDYQGKGFDKEKIISLMAIKQFKGELPSTLTYRLTKLSTKEIKKYKKLEG